MDLSNILTTVGVSTQKATIFYLLQDAYIDPFKNIYIYTKVRPPGIHWFVIPSKYIDISPTKPT